MKNNFYVAPSIESIEVEVESGIAATGGEGSGEGGNLNPF